MASFLQRLRRLYFVVLIIASVFGVFIISKNEVNQYIHKRLKEAFKLVSRIEELRTATATTQRPLDTTLLPVCPDTPPNIHEPVKLNLTIITRDELKTKYPSHSGDRYRPERCRSKQRLAVIIPYRDREQHLVILLNNLIPFLNKQQADFTIFVAEQAPGGTFNRGLMINAGVAASLREDNFTCFVIHDVDLIPETSDNYYRCRKNPFHLSTANAKFRYRLPYSWYVGGIIALTPSLYKRINGFSNWFFGWGGEDDDFAKRMQSFGLRVERNSIKTGRYYAQSHGKDKGNPINPKRFILVNKGVGRLKTDGLSSTRVNTTVSHRGVVTWLTVSIDTKYYARTVHR
ncbi:beta-1,4-galactosyltransferase 4-like [Haliotis rufescens]|uniref:beta-1,4-galactosyltransferase 4-like n=1 Tax=Haliotis rufescens TaxID=6454 RepID=UPI00201E9E07|nr:beta-1,4-galactosyltransferase 4-like [Haliotis rufescens]